MQRFLIAWVLCSGCSVDSGGRSPWAKGGQDWPTDCVLGPDAAQYAVLVHSEEERWVTGAEILDYTSYDPGSYENPFWDSHAPVLETLNPTIEPQLVIACRQFYQGDAESRPSTAEDALALLPPNGQSVSIRNVRHVSGEEYTEITWIDERYEKPVPVFVFRKGTTTIVAHLTNGAENACHKTTSACVLGDSAEAFRNSEAFTDGAETEYRTTDGMTEQQVQMVHWVLEAFIPKSWTERITDEAILTKLAMQHLPNSVSFVEGKHPTTGIVYTQVTTTRRTGEVIGTVFAGSDPEWIAAEIAEDGAYDPCNARPWPLVSENE